MSSAQKSLLQASPPETSSLSRSSSMSDVPIIDKKFLGHRDSVCVTKYRMSKKNELGEEEESSEEEEEDHLTPGSEYGPAEEPVSPLSPHRVRFSITTRHHTEPKIITETSEGDIFDLASSSESGLDKVKLNPSASVPQNRIEVNELDLNNNTLFPYKSKTRVWVNIITDALSQNVSVPVVVLRGCEGGPILGVTAAVHGDELNGVQVIHHFAQLIDVETLKGTIVCVPVVNMYGVINGTRKFYDYDLNRSMPGKEVGNAAEMFAYQFLHKIIYKLHFLIDLHTAGKGRANSIYVRVDTKDPHALKLAMLQRASIIVHRKLDGTLRAAAAQRGITAITVEIGDPQQFQKDFVENEVKGLLNVVRHLKMANIKESYHYHKEPTICSTSDWVIASTGGLLVVLVNLNDRIKKGDKLAVVVNVFGDVVETHLANCDAIVIGKTVHPVCRPGDKIIHLGIEDFSLDKRDAATSLELPRGVTFKEPCVSSELESTNNSGSGNGGRSTGSSRSEDESNNIKGESTSASTSAATRVNINNPDSASAMKTSSSFSSSSSPATEPTAPEAAEAEAEAASERKKRVAVSFK